MWLMVNTMASKKSSPKDAPVVTAYSCCHRMVCVKPAPPLQLSTDLAGVRWLHGSQGHSSLAYYMILKFKLQDVEKLHMVNAT